MHYVTDHAKTALRISAVLTPEQRAQMPLPDQDILWFDTILTHGL